MSRHLKMIQWLSEPQALLRILLNSRRALKNWPVMLIFNRYLINKRVTYRLRNGTAFHTVGFSDWGPIRAVWIDEAYNPAGFEIGETDVVLDVGAHIGAFSLYAAGKASRGSVYAFEPHPETFRILQRNVSQGQVGNIIIDNVAVGGEIGRQLLYISVNVLAHTTVAELRREDDSHTCEVPSVNIESIMLNYNLDRIDFLKLNCEGGEYSILQGAPDRILSAVHKMAVQYHDIDETRNGPTLVKFLREKGYSVEHSSNDLYKIIFAKRR